MLEHRARPTEVDPVTFLALDEQMRDRRHVNDAMGTNTTKHFFGRALSNIELVHLDALRSVGKRPTVHPEDLMPFREQALREHLAEPPGNPGNENFHVSPRRRFLPTSMRSAMRSLTRSTFAKTSSSSSAPVPSKNIGSE